LTATEVQALLELGLPELQAEILRLLWAHGGSEKRPAHRSTVEGYVLLDVERSKRQDLTLAALRGGLRRQVALALLALQQRGLVTFAPQGIELTEGGARWLVGQAEQAEDGRERQNHADTIVSVARDCMGT